MPGTLYVVATPIGNLEDVTLRALRVLREVSLIAAEDTRRTARLLQHYSISTRTTSLHEHNERLKTPELIARLQAGESIALVSDAGTPVVSDPGTHFIGAAHLAGLKVEPIPGPSALLAALSTSGLPGSEFIFLGFPPFRSNARNTWLSRVASEARLLVIYEAPHRIEKTLTAMLAILGDRRLALSRELTKMHESLVVRPISGHIAAGLEIRGEYTLVVEGAIAEPNATVLLPEPAKLLWEFGELTNNGGLSRREGLKALSLKYARPARDIFSILEGAKNRLGDQI